MMTLEEKTATINKVMQSAMGAGMCRTVKQFAELLGVNKAGLSSALNGDPKNCTDSLVRKVQTWAAANGLNGEPAPQKAQPSVTIPGETIRFFENLSETIRSQQQTIAQLVQAVTTTTAAPSYIPGQKNFRPAEH